MGVFRPSTDPVAHVDAEIRRFFSNNANPILRGHTGDEWCAFRSFRWLGSRWERRPHQRQNSEGEATEHLLLRHFRPPPSGAAVRGST